MMTSFGMDPFTYSAWIAALTALNMSRLYGLPRGVERVHLRYVPGSVARPLDWHRAKKTPGM